MSDRYDDGNDVGRRGPKRRKHSYEPGSGHKSLTGVGMETGCIDRLRVNEWKYRSNNVDDETKERRERRLRTVYTAAFP